MIMEAVTGTTGMVILALATTGTVMATTRITVMTTTVIQMEAVTVMETVTAITGMETTEAVTMGITVIVALEITETTMGTMEPGTLILETRKWE